MKAYWRDLIMMDHNIADDMFTCFLQISMPPAWNYIFAGLPANYSSAKVERHVKDEHGVQINQESVASAYHAGTIQKPNKS